MTFTNVHPFFGGQGQKTSSKIATFGYFFLVILGGLSLWANTPAFAVDQTGKVTTLTASSTALRGNNLNAVDAVNDDFVDTTCVGANATMNLTQSGMSLEGKMGDRAALDALIDEIAKGSIPVDFQKRLEGAIKDARRKDVSENNQCRN